MKTSPSTSRIFTIGSTAAVVALFALAGCVDVPTRQATDTRTSRTDADVSIGKLVLPEPRETVLPVYPWDLKLAGVVGLVRLIGLADESGTLQDIKVVDSTDDRFTNAALDALRKWTFTPALRNGKPVPMRIVVPIRFALE